MFFVTGPAPRSVLYSRVVVPVLLVFAYVGLRVVPAVDGRIPWYELFSMGAAIVGLTTVALLAVVDIALNPLIARAEEHISALEITAEISGIRDIDFAVANAYHDGMGHPIDDDVAPGPLVRRGAMIVAEPTLITHEYEAIHHTPARGFAVPVAIRDDEVIVANIPLTRECGHRSVCGCPVRMSIAHPPLTQTARTVRATFDRPYFVGDAGVVPTGTITGRLPSPSPRAPGRHRLNSRDDREAAPEQVTRERTGGFFGVFG